MPRIARSVVPDENHLPHAVRYVGLNPVRDCFGNFAGLPCTEEDEATVDTLRLAETTGRPLGAKP
ncbi:hypothetical protein FZC33_06300 [Labrys sp. KNU-23]|uniref:hypothetical protein n=1 Tax=Labrys sp. KNU-23 TaxID=2789216 RepID=UPI0011EC10E1|nr:hypothetical protein [Labrys sp. KNU-23]QEN85837.1 hypothetical protein FZC33_06300 [Labrys sp. KNU-23]